MRIKDRAMAVYHGEEPDRIPWLIYGGLCPRGYMARQLRNKGLGLKLSAPVFREEMPHVRTEVKTIGNVRYTTFHTPVGDLTMKERIGLTEGAGGSWIIEHPIKGISDMEAAKFMVEDIVYVPDYEPFVRVERNLGDDGVVFVWAGRSPIQEMQIKLMGYRTFARMLYTYPDEFRELLDILERKSDERYGVIAESPAEIINGTDNISSEIVSPRLYEKYIIPFYRRQYKRLHKAGKILENHLDGRLSSLKHLIAKTDLDVIEAFTPPPMGDLPLSEARKVWRDKIISLNFPESIFVRGYEATRSYMLNLLREAAPGDRLMITITEDIPPEHRWTGLSAITDVLWERGRYPLPS